MKALRRKNNKEWLSEITKNGDVFTGLMPKEIADCVYTVKQIEGFLWTFDKNKVDLSDYELVTIKIVVDE